MLQSLPTGIARPQPAPAARPYTVRPGDSLWTIAGRELGDPLRWPAIQAENRGRYPGLTRQPQHIQPGWQLAMPEASRPAPRTYTVRPGDTLGDIAVALLGSYRRWPELVRANANRYPTLVSRPQFLMPGWVLTLPARSTTPPAQAPRRHTVRPGDTLTDLAVTHLGRYDRWTDIVKANAGRYPTLPARPDFLRAGWVLDLPTR